MTRFGEPEEVAAAVVWLCSDEASFVTGVALPVDAGSVAWVSAHRDVTPASMLRTLSPPG